MKLRAGGLESVYISVKGRIRFKGSLYQSFLHAFPQGLALVHNGEVSVIVRGTQARVNCRLIQIWHCFILYFS